MNCVNKSFKRLSAVVRKEFNHIMRDPASLLIVFLMPVFMVIIYGYAMNFDLENIDTVFINFSKSRASSDFISKYTDSDLFTVKSLRDSEHKDPVRQAEKLLRRGEIKQYIIIPLDFDSDLRKNYKAQIVTVIDGADSNVANLVHQYNERIVTEFSHEYLPGPVRSKNISTLVYFNPEIKSSFFFIPGLIAVLLIMISALLTSLSISGEKERGSIDLIFISPLKSWEIIIGKTLPYIAVSFIVEALIIFLAIFWFNIPFRGSIPILGLFSLLFIITGLSLGILISTIAPNQKTAMFAALLGTLLPSLMLSGFIFPVESMPTVLKLVTHAVPATYFLRIIRGIVLKGADIKYFIYDGSAMIIFSFVLLCAAIIKFSKDRKRKI